jgi:hypothetical protein
MVRGFGWIGRRLARSALKKLETDPELQEEARKTALRILQGPGNTGGFAPESPEKPESASFSPEEGAEEPESAKGSGKQRGSGDLLLDGYVSLYQRALASGDEARVVKYAGLVQQRQEFLIKSERNRANAMRRRGGGEDEEEEGGEEAPINLNDLRPHATEIADGLIDALAEFIPGDLLKKNRAMARTYIAGLINEHPDVVPKAQQAISKVVDRFFKGIVGQVQGGQADAGRTWPSGYDPRQYDAFNPLTWPPQWLEQGI